MRIQILSDLHCEILEKRHVTVVIDDHVPTDPSADVVVFAGDINQSIRFIEDAPRYRKGNQHFIYVPGNHEAYNISSWERLIARCNEYAKPMSDWLHFLYRDSVTINHVEFIGATLWTDGKFGGVDRETLDIWAQKVMADYRFIKTDGRLISMEDTFAWHQEDLSYLTTTLERNADGRKRVVVTHHLPHAKSVHPQYADSLVNGLFASDLDESLVSKADLWVHGHTHNSMDYEIGKCRVIANPRGYPMGQNEFENPEFDRHKIICI